MVIRDVGIGLGDRVSVIQTVLVVLIIVLLLTQINILIIPIIIRIK